MEAMVVVVVGIMAVSERVVVVMVLLTRQLQVVMSSAYDEIRYPGRARRKPVLFHGQAQKRRRQRSMLERGSGRWRGEVQVSVVVVGRDGRMLKRGRWPLTELKRDRA